ncbi:TRIACYLGLYCEROL ACIDIC LIPASE TAL5 [Salix purpurea]|uniref:TRIACYLGLYCEROL ACIDIC LIPASE TAL5 n=1 Tax=Salix purpurea TaxID=77065 RepID=A0A9Q0SIV6_SALPP|nr:TRIACYLGLYCEROL ACIDIC LIPASE TAL5 [Salix purpurea]
MANSNDDHFSKDKLLLDPKEASLKELVLLLFFSDVRSRKFVDCPEEQQRGDFNRRWLIFISVLVQKVLLFCKEPLARIGQTLENWLNLISNNGGLFKLFLSYLKGDVVRPDESSAAFRSVIGHCDWRVDLDRSSRPGQLKYNTSLSLMAAKLSYENKAFIETVVTDHWNMEFLGSYDFWNEYQERASTQAFMFQDKKVDPSLIVVAFRGTNPFDADDWSTDVDLSWYELEGIGKLHRGFMKALGLQKNGWPTEIEQGAVLTLHEEAWLLERLEGVYTFGQPRVGDGQFGEFMVDKLKKVLHEEPNKNYFSLSLILPKYFTAVWEFIRSLIIPYLRGQSYRESWFMSLLRVSGLIIPGISEHALQDYDNSTRLGSFSTLSF